MSQGYGLLVLGGDKWAQIQEPHWYAGIQDQERALAMLPPVTIAARSNIDIPDEMRLSVAPEHVQDVSSTAARTGELHMMTDAALTFANTSGAWVDQANYERWCNENQSER